LMGDESFSFLNTAAGNIRLPSYRSAKAAFDRVFNFGKPQGVARNKKVVDRVIASYAKLKSNPRLSSQDKLLVDAHMSLLSELENRLINQTPLTGTPPTIVDPAGDIQKEYEAWVDVGVAALQCGATQVVCINAYDNAITDPNGWHHTSHQSEVEGVTYPDSLKINKWYAEAVYLRMIRKMSEIMEPNGKTLLQNSIVYWGNEISQGNGHTPENMPVVLAGSAGGFLRTGKFLDYSQYGAAQVHVGNEGAMSYVGRLYNQLLVTILQAMGLSPSDYEQNGIAGYGLNTSLSADRNKRYEMKRTEVGQVLPRVRV
jgi:hypothetical protein